MLGVDHFVTILIIFFIDSWCKECYFSEIIITICRNIRDIWMVWLNATHKRMTVSTITDVIG